MIHNIIVAMGSIVNSISEAQPATVPHTVVVSRSKHGSVGQLGTSQVSNKGCFSPEAEDATEILEVACRIAVSLSEC
jgi:hypothetical protein